MVACCWLVDWKVNCQAECHQSNTSANILHTSPLTVYSLVILHTDFVSTGAHLAFQLINNKSQHVPSLFPSDHRSPINMILSDLKTNCFFSAVDFVWRFEVLVFSTVSDSDMHLGLCQHSLFRNIFLIPQWENDPLKLRVKMSLPNLKPTGCFRTSLSIPGQAKEEIHFSNAYNV